MGKVLRHYFASLMADCEVVLKHRNRCFSDIYVNNNIEFSRLIWDGEVEVYACCDTLQVNDYSKFNMAGFNEEHKKEMREKQFPKDL